MSDGKPTTPPAASSGSGAAGGCVAPCADDPCGKDAISNVTKCCGTEIYEEAKRANGGRAPTLVMGTPPGSFGGATDTSTGTITIRDTLDKCQATQVALFELANLAAKPTFDAIDTSVAVGDIAREDYTKRTEKVEYENLKKASAAEKNCMDKWGCAGQTPRHGWVDPIANFDDYYNNHLAEEHKNHYRNAWDSNYKAAYDAKHPPRPR